ncbi:MAG TPA: class I SAM-dependent methyltransferase, partial [Roseiflexaceae bacterium]|nr:class I SAM-dependent methyltransferase [Roseiflexaceae bacterium]
MNLELLAWLRSEQGQPVLAEAENADLGAPARLRTLERLRRQATPEQAAAAYEMALLRRRAADKFSHAAQMFFTRTGLEQSSGERIARQRAGRYAALLGGAGQVADLCCGIGGDTLALAQTNRVIAVDVDPVRLAIAQANAEALGVAGRVSFLQRDLEQTPPPECDAIFFDPSRRQAGRRVFRLAEYRPPIALAQQWRRSTPAIGIKLAPGVAHEELDTLGATETEFISVDGELKEAVAWMGPLGVPGRRATVMRAGAETVSLWFASGDSMPDVPIETP